MRVCRFHKSVNPKSKDKQVVIVSAGVVWGLLIAGMGGLPFMSSFKLSKKGGKKCRGEAVGL